jgi:hypothetical protein
MGRDASMGASCGNRCGCLADESAAAYWSYVDYVRSYGQQDAPVRESMKQTESLDLKFTPALFVNGEEVRVFRSV